MKIPEIKLWKLFVSLGVPGLAVGVFYLLMNRFEWAKAVIPEAWGGPLALVFMLLTTGVILYALTLWRPKGAKPTTQILDKAIRLVQFSIDESRCIYRMYRYEPSRDIFPNDGKKWGRKKWGQVYY